MTTSAKQGTASRAVKLRRWAVVLSIMALSALGGSLAWRWVQDGERQEALRLAERGDFSNAEPLLKRVAERHPSDTQVARALALGYLSTDRLAEAETYFGRWCAGLFQPVSLPNCFQRSSGNVFSHFRISSARNSFSFNCSSSRGRCA